LFPVVLAHNWRTKQEIPEGVRSVMNYRDFMDSTPTQSPTKPNAEAIAWYVEEAQRLLEDQQRRAESLRTRGGQVAGFGAVFLALVGGNAAKILETVDGCAGTAIGLVLLGASLCLAVSVVVAVVGVIKPQPFAAISADEITNYLSDRFLSEPDLWRVHVRSLRALGPRPETLKTAATRLPKPSMSPSLRFSLALPFPFLPLVS
jgi:hypothetical protein